MYAGGKQTSTLALTRGSISSPPFFTFMTGFPLIILADLELGVLLPQTPKQHLLQSLDKTLMYSYYQHHHSVSAMLLFYLLLFVPAMPVRQALYPEALSYHSCLTFDIVMYKCVGLHSQLSWEHVAWSQVKYA